MWCFPKLHDACLWFSDTNQVSNDWTQFWHWLPELVWTSQIKNSVPQDCPFQTHTTNRVPGDPHFCSAGCRFGSSCNLPFPFWQFIRTTQKTQDNPLLTSTSLLQSLQLWKQKRCTGQWAVCTHSVHTLFRNTPFTTLICSPTRELLEPHLGDSMDVSLHSLHYIKSLVIVDWTQSPVPPELKGGAESSHPLITGLVPLATSSHPEAIWGPPRVTSLV